MDSPKLNYGVPRSEAGRYMQKTTRGDLEEAARLLSLTSSTSRLDPITNQATSAEPLTSCGSPSGSSYAATRSKLYFQPLPKSSRSILPENGETTSNYAYRQHCNSPGYKINNGSNPTGRAVITSLSKINNLPSPTSEAGGRRDLHSSDVVHSSQRPVDTRTLRPVKVENSVWRRTPPGGNPLAKINENLSTNWGMSSQIDGKLSSSQLPVPQNSQLSPSNSSQGRLLRRGMSATSDNLPIVGRVRDLIAPDAAARAADEDEGGFAESEGCPLVVPFSNFLLPNLDTYEPGFHAFLLRDLIETSTLVSLERVGRLNWWWDLRIAQRLWPLATSGDGNCLLHAASLGMWGVHDRQLTLRKALYRMLHHRERQISLRRRWRRQQTLSNQQSGLVLSESEWDEEWKSLINLASDKPRSPPKSVQKPGSGISQAALDKKRLEGGGEPHNRLERSEEIFYESLEEFHVFVLAQVLRRPIVVVADTMLKDSNGEPLAPIPFGGIYLPLLSKPTECHRTPLVLTYDASHFSALVAMETLDDSHTPACILLMDPDLNLLPLHYSVDPGERCDWGRESKKAIESPTADAELALIQQYMNIQWLSIPSIDELASSSDGGTKAQDECEFGKKKVSRQMQSVVKSFGSIGRNMGRKFKNLRRGADSVSAGGGSSLSRKEGSPSMLLRHLQKGEVLAGRIHSERKDYQDRMVSNYLIDARCRYDTDPPLANDSSRCISCCVVMSPSPPSHKCLRCREKDSPGSDCADSGVVESGNSKFYMHNLPKGVDLQDSSPSAGEATDIGRLNNAAGAAHPACGVPDGCLNNLVSVRGAMRAGGHVGEEEKHVQAASSRGGLKLCRSPGCSFYGTQTFNDYCSACFRNRQSSADRKREVPIAF